MKGAIALRRPVATKMLSYGDHNTNKDAWLEIFSAIPYAASAIEIFDGSGRVAILSTGAAGSEAASALPFTLPPGGETNVVPFELPAGKRLAISPKDGNATTGLLIVNLYA